MFTYLKKPSVYISLIVLALLAAGGFFIASSPKSLGDERATASLQDIEQEVLITGVVKADKKVSLSFDRAGSVASLPRAIGSTVETGATLATLRNETERADIAEAEAAVGVAKAKLEGVQSGTRPEEIRVKESAALEKQVSFGELVVSASKSGSMVV